MGEMCIVKLKKIAEGITDSISAEEREREITMVCSNSSEVKPGALFIAIVGKKVDGHFYIDDAIKRGAIAVIAEKKVTVPSDVTLIIVPDTREILGKIASCFYSHPSKEMNMIGITGTNGKTSVSYFVFQLLNQLNHKSGIIGTVMNGFPNKELNVKRKTPTTPDCLELQAMLNEFNKKEAKSVVMEVSSMGLEMKRVNGMLFKYGVFTNLTQDHLDDHGSFENYKNAKLLLFSNSLVSIINCDDEHAEDFVKASKGNVITYGLTETADFYAKSISCHTSGVEFELVHREKGYLIKKDLLGKFNVYNLLASIAIVHDMGFPIKEIIQAVENVRMPKGRMEVIKSVGHPTVIVDYAHTDDALENVLKTLVEIKDGNLWTVFGCGGNRDSLKRPLMGRVAGFWSDKVVLTSDNPRDEDPLIIMEEIEKGITTTDTPYEKIIEREKAIAFSIENANEKDVIVIAGKGHETYQVIGEEKYHFDDVEIAKKCLEKKES
jgi:UDP-N-acetylmuramoyl-L-alanyl-D-glutamate--2,6-diaminopimelate ligase